MKGKSFKHNFFLVFFPLSVLWSQIKYPEMYPWSGFYLRGCSVGGIFSRSRECENILLFGRRFVKIFKGILYFQNWFWVKILTKTFSSYTWDYNIYMGWEYFSLWKDQIIFIVTHCQLPSTTTVDRCWPLQDYRPPPLATTLLHQTTTNRCPIRQRCFWKCAKYSQEFNNPSINRSKKHMLRKTISGNNILRNSVPKNESSNLLPNTP